MDRSLPSMVMLLPMETAPLSVMVPPVRLESKSMVSPSTVVALWMIWRSDPTMLLPPSRLVTVHVVGGRGSSGSSELGRNPVACFGRRLRRGDTFQRFNQATNDMGGSLF